MSYSTQKIFDGVLLGSKQLLRELRQLLWIDIDLTFDLCEVLVEILQSSQYNRQQRRSASRFLDPVRESFEKISPEQLIMISEHYFSRLEEGRRRDFCSVFVYSKPGERERAQRLFSLFNAAYAQVILGMVVDLGCPRESPRLAKLLGLLVQIVAIAPGNVTMENLVLAVSENDALAEKTMISLMENMRLSGLSMKPIRSIEYHLCNPERELLDHSCCYPVLDKAVEKFAVWLAKSNNEYLASREEVHLLIDWFRQEYSAFHELEQKLWHDIVLVPLRSLRPAGLEKVRINFSSRYREYLQLLPIAGECSHCQTKLWQLAGEAWIVTCFDLNPDSRLPRILAEDSTSDALSSMYRFAATYSFWKIVCSVRDTHTKKRLSTAALRIAKNESVAVRSFFRMLGSGRQISEEARQRSLSQMGRLPPEGMTFVGEFFRGQPQSKEQIIAFEAIPEVPGFQFSFCEFGYQE